MGAADPEGWIMTPTLATRFFVSPKRSSSRRFLHCSFAESQEPDGGNLQLLFGR